MIFLALTSFLIFVFGLAIGSFLNVLIDRIPQDQKIFGRSYCPNCKKKLSWRDLFPVFSFIFLRGQCRYCSKKISWQYPVVELMTGAVFVIVFLSDKFLQISTNFYKLPDSNLWQFIITNSNLLFFLFAASVLIVIFLTDLKYGIIPDKIVFPAIAVAFVYHLSLIGYQVFSLYNSLKADQFLGKYLLPPYSDFLWQRSFFWSQSLINTLLGSIGISLFFLFLILITRGRGMGGGDMKFGFLLGLLVGWPNMVGALFLGFLTGALTSVTLILIRRRKFGQTIPFGPFLVLGTFVMMLWGDRIVEWYMKMF